MSQLEQIREQCANLIEQTRIYSSSPKKIFDISQDARNEQAKIIRAMPLPEVKQEPFGWCQYADGIRTQNFARNDAELKNMKEMAATFGKGMIFEYVPVFALPLPEVNQEPVAWVMTMGDDIKNHLQFFTCKGIAEQSLIDESEWGLENLKLQPLYFNLPDSEALLKKNEQLNALLLATNNDLMSALNHVHELNEAISNFNALIEFVQTTDEPMKVLDLWQHGCFEELREFWPEAPEAIYPKERAK